MEETRQPIPNHFGMFGLEIYDPDHGNIEEERRGHDVEENVVNIQMGPYEKRREHDHHRQEKQGTDKGVISVKLVQNELVHSVQHKAKGGEPPHVVIEVKSVHGVDLKVLRK